MQIPLRHPGVDFGLVERAAETVSRPRSTPAISQDRGRALWNALQDIAKRAVQRDDCLAAVLALAGGEHDRVVADVRPRHAHQIAQTQAGVASEIDGVGDLGRARFLDVRKVGICTNDLRAVVTVEMLDPFAGIPGDLAKRIDRVGKHPRKHLHSVVGSAGSVGPLIAPSPDHWPNFFRTIKLRYPEIAEMLADAIQP